jgi:subtilisin family serine protease
MKPLTATPVSLQQRLIQTKDRAKEIASELGDHTEDQVLLKVSPELGERELKKLAADYNADILKQLDIPDVMKDEFQGQLLLLQTGPNLSEAQTLAALEGDARVLLAATNDTMELLDGKTPENRPNDLHAEQWALHNKDIPGGREGADISALEAWTVTTGGGKDGPIVAVIDSGIDAYHEDIKANMWTNPNEIRDGKDNDWDGFTDDIHGFNTVEETGNIFDEVGHGTHVAGIIGAQGNNDKGISGVNWDSQLLGVKIADGERVSLVAAITGTLYATERGARIANHSWGGPRRNPILEDVMKSSPMLHVCAAGNSQKNSDEVPFYPAGFDSPNIVSVGASTRQDNALFFSNWGANTVDVHAPGARVYSTLPVHKYDELSGTSMAAPHVSGVAALVASKYPDATNAQLKDRIMYSSDPIEEMRPLSVSGGRLNAFKALEDDQVAPADITGFQVTETTADGLKADWNGVGDDGMDGQVARYQLQADFGEGPQRLIPDFPKQPGVKEDFTFRALPEEEARPFTLSLNAVDNVGNRSAVVQASGVIPAAEVPLRADFEGQNTWSVEGTWDRVKEEGRGLVYTDSPDGPHEPGSDTSLTSPAFNLKGLRNARLTFDAKMVTNKYDFLFVEVSTDGESWKNLHVLRKDRTPGYGEWGSYSYDLSKYDDSDHLQVRFNYEPSNNSKEDGVYVDRVRVLAAKRPHQA